MIYIKATFAAILAFLGFVSLFFAFGTTSSFGAVQISVPAAVGGGYMLQSTSTGKWVASSTEPLYVGAIIATSTNSSSSIALALRIKINNGAASPGLFVGTSTTGCPLYGCLSGELVDGELDFNGIAAFNIANGTNGPCAGSGIFADGNIVAVSSDYSFFGFLNAGWTGSGCAVGNGLERPESTLASNPTGDMNLELGSTSRTVAFNFYTQSTNLSMKLTQPGQLLLGTTTGSLAQFSVASSSGPQISLSDALGSVNWTERNINGNYYLASSTFTATSTTAAISINSSNIVSISNVASTTKLVISNAGGTGTRCLQVGADGTVSANASACGAGSVTSVTGTWPILSSGGATPAISWGGLATSASAVQGNLLYFTDAAKSIGNVATSAPTFNGGLTTSGTAGAWVGGSSYVVSISAPVSIANGGTNATSFTTNGNVVYWDNTRLSTALTTAAATLPYATTTSISSVNGAYFGTTAGGMLSVGSTTPWGLLSVNANGFTTAAPQFTVGSSTAQNFIVANNGKVGVATSAPWALFSINPDDTLGQIGTGPVMAIGSSTGVTLFSVFQTATSSLVIGSTTVNRTNAAGVLTLGSDYSGSSSSTIQAARYQIDTYDSAGTHRCAFFNNAGTWTSTAGACIQ